MNLKQGKTESWNETSQTETEIFLTLEKYNFESRGTILLFL